MKKRQKAGFIAKETVLVLAEDPLVKIGSGGATINALLMVTEMLSSQHGYTVANADTIMDASILILHLVRMLQFSLRCKTHIEMTNSHLRCIH